MDEKENKSSRFESEMTRMMNLVITKLDAHDKRFDNLENRFDNLENRFDNLEKDVSKIKIEVAKNSDKLDVLTGQFNDVAIMAIEDNKRITKLEKDVEGLKSSIH